MKSKKEVPAVAPEYEGLGREMKGIAEKSLREARCHGAIAYQVSISAPCVHSILFIRRMRKDFLGIPLADAAWEMILTILAARLDGTDLSPSELARRCDLSAQATVHLLRRLEREGLAVRREPEEPDGLVLVDLTDQAAARLCHYLDAA